MAGCPSIDGSWRISEKERLLEKQASAQLSKSPIEAGVFGSFTTSRMILRTVDRTSLACCESRNESSQVVRGFCFACCKGGPEMEVGVGVEGGEEGPAFTSGRKSELAGGRVGMI